MPISSPVAKHHSSSPNIILFLRSKSRLILKLLLAIGLLFLVDHFWRTQQFIQFIPQFLPTPTLPPLAFNDSGAPSECYCNGELFCFKGVNKLAKVEYGRPFNCSLYHGLAENGLLFKDIRNTEPYYEKMDENWDPVFVTSVAENHVSESRTLLKRIRTFYPTSKIIIFDIGLSSSAVEELGAICNVEVKAFNFSKYPAHVTHLKNYSFKLVLLEALKLYKVFFYYDTSVLIQNSNIHASFLEAVKSGLLMPFSTHSYTYHSVFAATHPTMYEYLPVAPEAVQIEEAQSSSMFVIDSSYTRRVMKWWYLCAVTEDCIAPQGSNVKCDVWRFRDRWHVYMNCHRFDQSFWNIYSIVEIFGEERRAIRQNYIDHDFDYIDTTLSRKVEKNRHKILNNFFKSLVKIKRGNPTHSPLKWPCVVNEKADDESNDFD